MDHDDVKQNVQQLLNLLKQENLDAIRSQLRHVDCTVNTLRNETIKIRSIEKDVELLMQWRDGIRKWKDAINEDLDKVEAGLDTVRVAHEDTFKVVGAAFGLSANQFQTRLDDQARAFTTALDEVASRITTLETDEPRDVIDALDEIRANVAGLEFSCDEMRSSTDRISASLCETLQHVTTIEEAMRMLLASLDTMSGRLDGGTTQYNEIQNEMRIMRNEIACLKSTVDAQAAEIEELRTSNKDGDDDGSVFYLNIIKDSYGLPHDTEVRKLRLSDGRQLITALRACHYLVAKNKQILKPTGRHICRDAINEFKMGLENVAESVVWMNQTWPFVR